MVIELFGIMNQFFVIFLVILIIAILITIINRFIDFIIPDVLVGISWILVLVSFILWITRNFFVSLWQTTTGKAIIISLILIISAIMLTSPFTKIKVLKKMNPAKTGKMVRKMG